MNLPLPNEHGLWPRDFSAQVDACKADLGVPRAEVFRRIAAHTGNSVKGLSLRYYAERERC